MEQRDQLQAALRLQRPENRTSDGEIAHFRTPDKVTPRDEQTKDMYMKGSIMSEYSQKNIDMHNEDIDDLDKAGAQMGQTPDVSMSSSFIQGIEQ